jgi:hypothetical protein
MSRGWSEAIDLLNVLRCTVLMDARYRNMNSEHRWKFATRCCVVLTACSLMYQDASATKSVVVLRRDKHASMHFRQESGAIILWLVARKPAGIWSAPSQRRSPRILLFTCRFTLCTIAWHNRTLLPKTSAPIMHIIGNIWLSGNGLLHMNT